MTVYLGDALSVLRELPSESVHCVVTSPPFFGLRDYGVDGQIGLETTPEGYVGRLVEVFREARRALRRDGTCWLELGDSYSAQPGQREETDAVGEKQRSNHGRYVEGLKPKDLIGAPWMVAFALRADGWWLRDAIVWHRPNPMPESVTDRTTKAHSYVFLLTKSERYFYDQEAVREPHVTGGDGRNRPDYEPQRERNRGGRDDGYTTGSGAMTWPTGGRNLRSVWTIATQPFAAAHFATFPEDLVIPCIKAGCQEGGIVLDPFAGSGTTLAVARRLGRRSIGIELQGDYLPLIRKRVEAGSLPLLELLG